MPMPNTPAAVSCSSVPYGLGGVKIVSGTTGKLGCASHRCMGGAWHFGWASWAVQGAWCMASVHGIGAWRCTRHRAWVVCQMGVG